MSYDDMMHPCTFCGTLKAPGNCAMCKSNMKLDLINYRLNDTRDRHRQKVDEGADLTTLRASLAAMTERAEKAEHELAQALTSAKVMLMVSLPPNDISGCAMDDRARQQLLESIHRNSPPPSPAPASLVCDCRHAWRLHTSYRGCTAFINPGDPTLCRCMKSDPTPAAVVKGEGK